MTHLEMLARWPVLQRLVDSLGCQYSTVHGWVRRGVVPPKYWERLAEVARKEGQPDVTVAALRRAYTTRMAERPPRKNASNRRRQQENRHDERTAG